MKLNVRRSEQDHDEHSDDHVKCDCYALVQSYGMLTRHVILPPFC